MKLTASRAALFTFAIMIGVCICGSRQGVAGRALNSRPEDQGTGKRSVWDGVYTERQARRGETVYARSCEPCHASGLTGNDAADVPSLVFDTFMARWGGRTLGELYEKMRTTMPADDRGSLSPRLYVDIAAYVLESNQLPSGNTELDPDRKQLDLIVIERA